jgi:hypothetical protein
MRIAAKKNRTEFSSQLLCLLKSINNLTKINIKAYTLYFFYMCVCVSKKSLERIRKIERLAYLNYKNINIYHQKLQWLFWLVILANASAKLYGFFGLFIESTRKRKLQNMLGLN